VGFREYFGLAPRADLGIVSPWAPESHLAPMIVGDILGADWPTALPMTRETALALPPVSKARNLLVSVIADLPLKALGAGSTDPLSTQPTFLYRSDSDVTTYARMAMTVDDLFFHGHALWAVARGSRGEVLDAAWIPTSRWTITNGNILVDSQPVDSREVLYFQIPGYAGLLNVGNAALRAAQDLEAAAARNLRVPIPGVILKKNDTGDLSQAEVNAALTAWKTARRDPDGAVAFLPKNVDFEVIQSGQQDNGYLEAKNAMVTAVGQLVNIRSSMLDGTSSVDSLTYVTDKGQRNAFYDFDLPFWTSPIEARLSADDVVPRGQRVRFSFYDTQNPATPTGEAVED
jgi:hypothetical protein